MAKLVPFLHDGGVTERLHRGIIADASPACCSLLPAAGATKSGGQALQPSLTVGLLTAPAPVSSPRVSKGSGP
ncbi:MAG: hypothetical protein L0387_30460, partial [Acidobacteria bacterium]|nr:hypothetical protein [Acidobacteriota bacterium]